MTRKRKPHRFDGFYMLLFLGAIVFFLAIVTFPTAIGLDPALGTTLTQLFPTVFLSCIAIYMLAQSHKTGKFGGMMFLGLALCLFLDTANTHSLLTAELLTGLTVLQLQTWVMVFSIIFGAIVFSYK